MSKINRRKALSVSLGSLAAIAASDLPAKALDQPAKTPEEKFQDWELEKFRSFSLAHKKGKHKLYNGVVWCLHRAGGIPLPLAEVCAEAMRTKQLQTYSHKAGDEVPNYYVPFIQEGENPISSRDAFSIFSCNYPTRLFEFLAHSEGALVGGRKLAPDEPFVGRLLGGITWKGIDPPSYTFQALDVWTAMLITLRTNYNYDGFELFDVPQWWRKDT